MRVIIAGTRTICDEALVERAIVDSKFPLTAVLCGCADGVDQIGSDWATEHDVRVIHFKADWAKHGRAAGPIRNRQMAETADALILVWDGKSRGSANMLKTARELGLKIHEVKR